MKKTHIDNRKKQKFKIKKDEEAKNYKIDKKLHTWKSKTTKKKTKAKEHYKLR